MSKPYYFNSCRKGKYILLKSKGIVIYSKPTFLIWIEDK